MIDVPSVDQIGENAPPASWLTCVALPPAAATVNTCDTPLRVDVNASCDPSGLHAGDCSGTVASVPVASIVAVGKPVSERAGAGTIQMRGSPERLLVNAMRAPFGLNAGSKSFAALLVTRCCTAPTVSEM